MIDELKKQHLEGLHKNIEETLIDSCILCENYINAKKTRNLTGKTLDVMVNEIIDLSDIFA